MINKIKSQQTLNKLMTPLEISFTEPESLFTFIINANDSLLEIKKYITDNKTELSTEMLSRLGSRNVIMSAIKNRVNYDNITLYFINTQTDNEITYTINEIVNNDIYLKKCDDIIYIELNNVIYVYECFIVDEVVNFFTNDELYRLQRIYQALTADYSPIENTDVYETYSESLSQSASEIGSASNTSNNSQTATTNTNNSRNRLEAHSASETNDIVAFNENSLTTAGANHDSTSTSESENYSESTNTQNSLTSNEDLHNSKESNGIQTTEHTLHRHGNIGVTSNVQLILSELDLRGRSLYDIIINVITDKILSKIY